MNKYVLPAIHGLVIVVASLVLARVSYAGLSWYPHTSLDPNQVQHDMLVQFSPADATAKVGNRDMITIKLDNNGQVPTTVSLALGFPSQSITLGNVSSPVPSCQSTLRLTRADNQLLLKCSLERSSLKTQIADLFSVSYVPTQAGSAIIQMLPNDSSASGPNGALHLTSRDASLTITP